MLSRLVFLAALAAAPLPAQPARLELSLDETSGSFEAMVARVVHLGFEVRVDLIGADGDAFSAQLTRDEEAELELESGQIVFVSSQSSVRAPGLGISDEVMYREMVPFNR